MTSWFGPMIKSENTSITSRPPEETQTNFSPCQKPEHHNTTARTHRSKNTAVFLEGHSQAHLLCVENVRTNRCALRMASDGAVGCPDRECGFRDPSSVTVEKIASHERHKQPSTWRVRRQPHRFKKNPRSVPPHSPARRRRAAHHNNRRARSNQIHSNSQQLPSTNQPSMGGCCFISPSKQ